MTPPLNTFCDVEALTVATGSYGAGTGSDTWTKLYVAIPCRYEDVSGLEAQRFGLTTETATGLFYIPAAYAVTAAHRMVLNAKKYRIVHVNETPGGERPATFKEVFVIRFVE